MATYEIIEINDGHYVKLLKVLKDANNNSEAPSNGDGDQTPKRNLKIVIIPGNPGLVEFYEQFACELNELTQSPVICVSHTGHLYDRSLTDWQPADVDEQVEHKVKFIEKHLNADGDDTSDLVFIGHSIGCYCILQLLNRLNPAIKKRVKKAILLFPTVERMRETPNGKILTFLTKRKILLQLIYLVAFMLACLPAFIRRPLIKRLYLDKHAGKRELELCDNMPTILFHMTRSFSCARSILHMGRDEMLKVTELDKTLVRDHADLLVFYYGTRDRWCPIDYYFDMLDRAEKCCSSDAKPEILLDKLNLSHGFVIHKNQCSTVAKLAADWINSI